jgi:hypothetical protein
MASLGRARDWPSLEQLANCAVSRSCDGLRRCHTGGFYRKLAGQGCLGGGQMREPLLGVLFFENQGRVTKPMHRCMCVTPERPARRLGGRVCQPCRRCVQTRASTDLAHQTSDFDTLKVAASSRPPLRPRTPKIKSPVVRDFLPAVSGHPHFGHGPPFSPRKLGRSIGFLGMATILPNDRLAATPIDPSLLTPELANSAYIPNYQPRQDDRGHPSVLIFTLQWH